MKRAECCISRISSPRSIFRISCNSFVSVPLEAPLRLAAGSLPGRFVQAIVRVVTDDGMAGLVEVGGCCPD